MNCNTAFLLYFSLTVLRIATCVKGNAAVYKSLSVTAGKGIMPEFRFRRKKKKQASSRRHTVHDTEEAHAQVAAVRERVRGEVRKGGGSEGGEVREGE